MPEVEAKSVIRNTAKPYRSASLENSAEESELLDGNAPALGRLAGTVASKLDRLGGQLNKLEHAAQPSGLGRAGRPAKSDVIGPDEPMLTLAYHHLKRELDALKLHQPHASQGLDPEGVHQMRMATRRSRVALGLFKEILPPKPRRHLKAELRWLAGVLGEVRDADVHGSALAERLTATPLVTGNALAAYRRHADEQRRQARARLVEALRGSRYQGLIEAYETFVEGAPTPAALRRWRAFSIADGAPAYIERCVAAVRRRGRRLGRRASASKLHALRIEGKRCRYGLEFFADFYRDGLARPLSAVKKLQDLLGDYQDARTASNCLRAFAASAAAASEATALDELVAIEEQRARRARKRFQAKWPSILAAMRPRRARLRKLIPPRAPGDR